MISIVFLGKYSGETQYNFLNNAVKKYFAKRGVQTKLVLFVDQKKLPEHLSQGQTITFLCRKDLNLFKKWNSQTAKKELLEQHDLLVSMVFNSTSFLDNFIKESKAKMKVGIQGSSSYPFDLEIIQNTEDVEALFEKIKKYLIKLK